MKTHARRPFALLLLLLCGMALAVLPAAAATDDDNVNTVQAHFHFKDPATGQDIAHDKLKAALLHPLGSIRYLDEGVVLSYQIDEKAQFGQNHYFQYAPDLQTLLTSALHLNTTDDLVGTLRDAVIAKSEDNGYFYAADALQVWDIYAAETGAWVVIDAFVQDFEISLINQLVRDYIASVSDPDNDAEEWSALQYEWGPIQQRNDFHIDLHEYCRTMFRSNQALNQIQPDLDKFSNAVKALIAGSVQFSYYPDKYALTAPVNVIVDASNSTGTDGSSIASYHWLVDGADGGTNYNTSNLYWTPGTHTVQCTVTDGNGATLTGSDTFTVGSPPLSAVNVDTNNLNAAYTTPANTLVATYKIDYGDGSPAYTLDNTNLTYNGTSISTPLHHYTGQQEYTATLTEVTRHGDTLTSTVPINFSPTPTDIGGGTLGYSQTWGVSGSPYRIHGSLFIPQGVRLTLDPGVVLQFDNYAGITVAGELVSQGHFSSKQEVYFTSSNDISSPPLSSAQQGADNGRMGDWQGITLQPGASVTLAAAVIRYASIGLSGSVASATVSGGLFDTCEYGINAIHTGLVTISGNTFLNCGVGVFDNSGGSGGNGPLAVTGNTFTSSGGASALYVVGYGQDVSTSGNTFGSGQGATFSATFGHLSFSGDQGTGGSRAVFTVSGTLSADNTWPAQAGIRLVSGGLAVDAGATLTLGPGAAIQFGNYAALTVRGDLRGPTGGLAYLTGTNDGTPYGGADGGGVTDWSGVTYAAGLTANLQTIKIAHASVGLSADTANLNGCTFSSNGTGVSVKNGGGVYRNCNFVGNGIAVQNNSTTNVDARGNWWGDPSGPYNALNNPTGKGNPVSNYVLVGPVVANLVSVSVSPTSVAGGQPSTGTVTLSDMAPAGGAVVTLSSNSAAASVLGSVTVLQGQTQAIFPVTTAAVATDTTATLTAGYGGVTRMATLTVTAPVLSSLTVNPTSVPGGTSATGMVTLSSGAPAGGLAVSLGSSSAAATVPTPASVTVASGQTTANFPVGSRAVAADTTATLSAKLGTVTKTATLTVQAPPAAVASLTFPASSLIQGHSLTGTVTLTKAAPAGGTVVTLTSGNAALSVPTPVTVPAGSMTAPVTVSASAVTATQTATVTASGGGASAQATLTVYHALVPVSLTLSPATVTGGSGSTATVTVNTPAPPGGATIALLTSDTGIAGPTPTTLLLPAGATSGTFPVYSRSVAAMHGVHIVVFGGNIEKEATLTVLPFPAVTLSATATLARSGPDLVATVIVTNSGATNATNVKVTASVLGSAATKTALPLTVGAVPAGTATSVVLRFPGSAGASGTASRLTVGGTYTVGSFSSAIRVRVP